MRETSGSSDAFTGLEAAIVLIAFVVVAAVFSYVVLGAGFYTTQKTQETIHKSVEQSTSNLLLTGNIYGLANDTAAGIDTIEFSLALAPGAADSDLTRMTVMYSSDTVAPIQYTYGGATADATHFSAVLSGTTTPVPSLQQNEQVTITIPLGPSATLARITRFNLEIRPAVGSAYSLTRTTGANIFPTNVL